MQGAALQAGEVRVDASLAWSVEAAGLPQAQRAGQQHLAARNAEVTALERAHPVAELGLLARMQLHLLRHEFEIHVLGQVVEGLHRQRLVIIVVQGQAHLAPASQRQVPGSWRCRRGVGMRRSQRASARGDQQQCQQQPPPQWLQGLRQLDAEQRQAAEDDRQGQQAGDQDE